MDVKTALELEEEIVYYLSETSNDPTYFIEDDLPCPSFGSYGYD